MPFHEYGTWPELDKLSIPSEYHYVAAKATYIRLFHGKIGIWEGGEGGSALAPYTGVGPI